MTTTTRPLRVKSARKQTNSAWAMAWRRFSRHKVALMGGFVVLLFAAMSIAAPWISPYDFREINGPMKFSSPSVEKAAFFPAGQCHSEKVFLWECGVYPLGTDQLGRDILTRVLYGGRVSLLVGIVGALISTILGSVLGALAAYVGGKFDMVISRLIDIMLSMPQIPLLLILSALLNNREVPLGQMLDDWLGSANKSIFIIILVFIMFYWMATARLVRGEVLSLKEREFTDAARVLGGGHFRVILRHLLPNAAAVIIVQFSLMMGEAILVESGLSFLGLGIQQPAVSWGNMLSGAQGFLFRTNGIFIAVFPGLFIFLAVLCFNLLGDGLRDALDPRSIRR